MQLVDATQTAIPGEYSSMLTLMAVASVCKVNVQSVYPNHPETRTLS